MKNTQTERIDTMISKGVNVLCVNPVDSSAGATILQKAKDAGIAIVFFNRMPELEVLQSYDKCWYVGENAYSQGSVQGELVAAEWEKNKEAWVLNGDGKLQYGCDCLEAGAVLDIYSPMRVDSLK